MGELPVNKTLTPQEALRALADGKKLSLPGWVGKYINLNGDAICYGGGAVVSFTSYDGFIEYTEPKPKVVWVEYLVWAEGAQADNRWVRDGTPPFFGMWSSCPTGRKIEV